MGPQEPTPYSVFSTISADSPGRGQAAAGVSLEKSGNPDFYRFSTQMSIGVTNAVSLGLNIPYVDDSVSGVEDVALTLKHRFFDEGKYGPSVAYLVTASVETSTEELSTDGRLGAGVVISKRVGPVKGHLNFIYAVPSDGDLEDEARFSAAMEFSAAHNFDVLAELFGKKSHFSKDVDEFEGRFGYRILHGEGVFTTIGAGLGLNDRAPDFRLMLSISLIFPRREAPIERIIEEGG